jgi:hypothetical protein
MPGMMRMPARGRVARATGRALAAIAVAGGALGGAGAAMAETVHGPTAFLAPTAWTDCGDGLGGSERLSTVAAGATAGLALHEHRYCPTRPVTVSYHFYAYDEADRNVCARLQTVCDPSLPFDAFVVATVTWSPGDFAPGGACFASGCPVIGALPIGNAAAIKNVIVEAIDDAGDYGLTHNVRWDPAPPAEPQAPGGAAPGAEPLAGEAPATGPAGGGPAIEPQLPAPGEEAPAPPAPDAPPSGPAAEPPAPDAVLGEVLGLAPTGG